MGRDVRGRRGSRGSRGSRGRYANSLRIRTNALKGGVHVHCMVGMVEVIGVVEVVEIVYRYYVFEG